MKVVVTLDVFLDHHEGVTISDIEDAVRELVQSGIEDFSSGVDAEIEQIVVHSGG